jgi:hypothetical protein
MENDEANLIIPVYLNQRIVFDMVAMLQGGIATVTKVSETSGQENAESREAKAAFGLSNAFSALLKIDLSGSKKNDQHTTTGKTVGEERVHTPSSLFYTLRGLLKQQKILKEDVEGYTAKPGDIIEFKAQLTRNPTLELLNSFEDLMDMGAAFGEGKQIKKNQDKPAQPDYQKFRSYAVVPKNDKLRG